MFRECVVFMVCSLSEGQDANFTDKARVAFVALCQNALSDLSRNMKASASVGVASSMPQNQPSCTTFLTPSARQRGPRHDAAHAEHRHQFASGMERTSP